MAFIDCHFHSNVLGRACSMLAIVPQRTLNQIGLDSVGSGRKNYPVLYLLHGLSDDHTIWMRRTSIERYAAQYELIIVMPTVTRFYTDNYAGRAINHAVRRAAVHSRLVSVSTRRRIRMRLDCRWAAMRS